MKSKNKKRMKMMRMNDDDKKALLKTVLRFNPQNIPQNFLLKFKPNNKFQSLLHFNPQISA